MVEIKINNLHIKYEDFHAVKGVSLEVKDAEILTLLGPSGCGKTSILRTIAGFQDPSEGEIYVGKENVIDLPAQKRDMGMIFQSYALWPHMTVEANIAYGLNIRKIPKAEQQKIVQNLINQVQLDGHEKKLPTQLSGGQQQRVALARALAIEPRVLLCDEPLSNLDFKLRVELRTLIRDVAKNFGVTVIYVTHDQTEALAISDKIAVMNVGTVVQVDTPINVYSNPNSLFVADFIGENNKLFGKIVENKGQISIKLNSGEIISLQIKSDTLKVDEDIVLVSRYNDVVITNESGNNVLVGKLKHKAYMGIFLQVEIQLSDNSTFTFNTNQKIESLISSPVGTEISVKLEKNLYLFSDGKRVY